MPKGFGFEIETDEEIRKDAFLFGESQSRAVVSVSAGNQETFVESMTASGLDFTLLGNVTSADRMIVDGEDLGAVSAASRKYNSVLADKMS